jgi:hypothetical protein
LLAILTIAFALPAFRLVFAAPLGHVNVNDTLPEAIAVQGTFYFPHTFG